MPNSALREKFTDHEYYGSQKYFDFDEILWWFLYFRVALLVRFLTRSHSLYFGIIRFLITFPKKSLQLSSELIQFPIEFWQFTIFSQMYSVSCHNLIRKWRFYCFPKESQYQRYTIISLFNIYGSILFISVFKIFLTKYGSSHNFFRKFFCKKWHLISSSICFLAKCILDQNINT